MECRLEDKVAIVTGAGRGLGATIAHTLAAAGARVTVNDINPDRAEQVARAIREAGGAAVDVHADVANKFQCVKLVEATRAEWGRLDVLVNNAYAAPDVSIIKMDEWDWNRCLEVNLKGTFFMSQLCGRVMADENRERGGAIVNVTSVAGVEVPLAGRAAYCASQAGVVGFARECAREYAQYGIRVNTVLTGRLVDDDAGETAPGERARREQAAAAVLFLCSDAGRDVTGSAMTVDGRHSSSRVWESDK
ncbi:MAG: SDR family NAD(P)-dependent oxidoreductase [Candidatus Promineifilaceae bacterium]|nr:SDR family NAD(P)-dependent oxidoreductase [Candidatus Promineifilaceae bacterium]